MTDFALPAQIFCIARESRAGHGCVVKDSLMTRAIVVSGLAHLCVALAFVCGPLLFSSAPSAAPLTIDVDVVDISELDTVAPPLAVPKHDEEKARAVIPPPQIPERKAEQLVPKEKPTVERPEVAEKKKPSQEVPLPASAPVVTSGTASVGGGSNAVQKARISYQDLVATKLARAKRYPDRAVRDRITGSGVIRLTIDATGDVVGAEVVTSTQAPILDEELLRMVGRAAPFPAFPSTMSQPQLALLVPVSFRLES